MMFRAPSPFPTFFSSVIFGGWTPPAAPGVGVAAVQPASATASASVAPAVTALARVRGIGAPWLRAGGIEGVGGGRRPRDGDARAAGQVGTGVGRRVQQHRRER